MKRCFIFLCLVILSCDSNKTVKIPASQIEMSPVVHDTLSTTQIENIRKIQAVFAEVNPSTLEETITNFKRDQHPDNEINIWLNMAAAYEKFTAVHKISLEKKEEAYKLILLRSMMPEAEAKGKAEVKLLTDEEIATIFSYYTDVPKPVIVR
jgi:hypothetical protein